MRWDTTTGVLVPRSVSLARLPSVARANAPRPSVLINADAPRGRTAMLRILCAEVPRDQGPMGVQNLIA